MPSTGRVLPFSLGKKRRVLSQRGLDFYNRLDLFFARLQEFPRGPEFYGKVKTAVEGPEMIRMTVLPVVGRERLDTVATLNQADKDGVPVFPSLIIADRSEKNGEIEFVLEKPGNEGNAFLLPKPGDLVTTNNQSFGFSRKIWANYDAENVVVYQAFGDKIASQAVKLQGFGDRFSDERTTWIKPSLLWLMWRSQWGSEDKQKRVLAIKITRSAFEKLLDVARIVDPTLGLFYQDEIDCLEQTKTGHNLVQWDPDKDLNGKNLDRRAIQLGVRPEFHEVYLDGIKSIRDITDFANRVREARDAAFLLPAEVPYPTPGNLLRRLEMHQYNPDESSDVMNEVRRVIGLKPRRLRSNNWLFRRK